ncbi:hypothetical protein A2Z00_00315 [Candidatus Gottesmanbacteria bacterium RBG_13_45_10]|uniref:Cohesin domain-containing protein n=1 Tax=Candidatus Gottesmanbacteria bacterium RBG_13_45_10 TaxID=1798370 RepID=A0A1F5ZHF7_9BACT|nr:MAG: hypothetical protein A2Z00_00315 [Candidatus Gottesmanbacteria bacterium RBG_13_45_10]
MDDHNQPPSSTDSQHTEPGSQPPTVILEQIPETVIVPTPWYKRLIDSGVRTQFVWKLSFVMMLVVGFVIAQQIQKPQNIVTKAGNSRANIMIVPSESRTKPMVLLQLWVNAESSVDQGQIRIDFDKTKMKLVSISTSKNPALAPALTFSSTSQANLTGTINVGLAITPSSGITAPSQTFQLIDMNFQPITTSPNLTTYVTVNAQGSKLFHGETPFTITNFKGSTVILNSGN